MPDINKYEHLTDDDVADILDTLAQGQTSEGRGIILLEAARRLRKGATT